jgi:prepilin-type N-terminal cleavage/methylation domain-containing protein
MKRKNVNMKNKQAFTLIELLTVMAIIAILASMVLPVLSMAKEKSYRAQCINNFKQLATAIQLYADDHNERLPGPVWQGFYESYDNIDFKRLPYYIANYMGAPAPQITPQKAPLARCPSAARHWKNAPSSTAPMDLNQPLSYIVSVAVTNINSEIVSRPFGYPDSSLPFAITTNDTAPRRIHEIANPAISWAMTDADQQNAVFLARYYRFQPKTPCHGKIRNELFFDWHVAAVPQ